MTMGDRIKPSAKRRLDNANATVTEDDPNGARGSHPPDRTDTTTTAHQPPHGETHR